MNLRPRQPRTRLACARTREQHCRVIAPVIRFLQGKDRTLASRIVDGNFLPVGPRVDAADLSHFGEMSPDDAARRLCTLYIEDLADLITSTIDIGFGLSRYGHHLTTGPVPWGPIAERFAQTTVIDDILDGLVDNLVDETQPDVVGLSFHSPVCSSPPSASGVGLKSTDPRGDGRRLWRIPSSERSKCDGLWDCVDALTYDDGEGPLLALLRHWEGLEDRRHRTRTAAGMHDCAAKAPPFTAIADYKDLPLTEYLSLVDGDNPAHRLWSDGRWNKMTLAHGCYWKKCAFCDVDLDYISRYESTRIAALVDHMEALVDETGQSGFHMVDERTAATDA